MKKQNKFVLDMRVNKPKVEGMYFCKYHRNFEPSICHIFKKNNKLWIQGKSFKKPLNKINAFCFSQRVG